MFDTRSASPRQRRWIRAGAVVAGVLAVYTALGFLAAPPLVRRLLVKEASAALKRDVTIAKVRVNPLALSVTIEGLAVTHRDGAPFLGWDSLYVRLAPLRLFTGDVGFAEIRLVRPALHAGLGADGALTFQDLLSGEDAPADTTPGRETGGLGVWIGELSVEQAQVAFRDATRRPVFDTAIGPITFRLESFRTKGGGDSPYAFTGTTDAGETLRWTGTLSTQPFRSAGTLGFERIALPRYGAYLQDELPADLRSGLLDFETQYELEWGADRRVVKLTGGKVTVDALAMGPRGSTDVPVALPRIEVTGIDVDALARDAKVGAVTVLGGTLRVRREADGTLELAKMAPPPSETPPWTWSIGSVAISGIALGWEDRAAPRPVSLPLTELGLRLEKLRSEPSAVSPLSVSLAWNGSGRIAVQGSVQPLGGKGTLEVNATDLDLVPLEPYLAESVAARLTGGRAGAKVKLGFDVSGAEPRWTFGGDVRLDGLAVAERGNEDLLRWRALEVSGIDAASTPPRASVRLVRLVEPRAKIYVWEDGATSLARALPAAPVANAPAAKAHAAAATPEWRTAIGAVEVVRGRAAFVDRSIVPPVVVNVTGANAKVTRLSSDPKVRSSVDVRLEVEGASPVRIAGTLNPLQKEAYTELTVASDGVDLSPLGPYSGRFLGYGIQKGKLDLDLRYKVQNRILAATNVVRVNQFTLGEAIESPDATKIPVRLALALLQDRDGVILLDVPVEGNLDDPEFRLGRVIWRTVLNVLVKVATSPFSALAALAGGGDDADLSMVEFAPGSAEPLPAAQERFALLAKSLAQRPALGLELEGVTDEAQDGGVLRRVALENRLRSAKAATLRPPPASLEGVTLAPDERARLLRAAYDGAFPAPGAVAKGAVPPPTPTLAEMEERLAAATEVPADAYRTLAAARAQHAREALVAAGLDQARLFLAQGGTRAASEQGPRVYFTVK
jgi:hypothetical protein